MPNSGGPAWLTPQYVESVLQKALREGTASMDFQDVAQVPDDKNIAVLSIRTTPAVGVNDNYLSDVWRVVITVCNHPEVPVKSIIVKVPPSSGEARELAVTSGMFPREIRMYREILPQLHKLQTQDMEPLGPRCLLVDEERSAIVLEDLREQGYLLADRKTGLNFEESRAAIISMARLHAASMALLSKNPKFGDGLSPYHADDRLLLFGPFFRGTLAALAAAVRYWPSLGPAYAAVLTAEAQRVDERLLDASHVKHAPPVLNHGDPWINNMMFRSSPTGQVLGHRFFDFQQITIGSPALDLHYFLSLSPERSVLAQHEDDLLVTYHEHLVARLTALGLTASAAGDLDDLRADLHGTSYWGALFTLTIRPIIMAEMDKKLTLESLVHEQEQEHTLSRFNMVDPRTQAVNNPVFREIVEHVLPEYLEKGILCSRPGKEVSSGLSLRRGSLHLS